MAKVHPNLAPLPSLHQPPMMAPAAGDDSVNKAAAAAAAAGGDGDGEAVVLTVWRKSLLFNCKGFTVFDASGDLVYRVDTYAADSRAEVVLMDAAGAPVLTVRRKKAIASLGLGSEQWLVYPGEETRRSPPLYAVKRTPQYVRGGGGGNGKSMAHVAACGGVGGGGYEVEGSYLRRRCTVYDERRRAVAEVQPKEAVGTDVFRLVVRPGMEVSAAMAVVLALDQMFGKPSLLRSWSS